MIGDVRGAVPGGGAPGAGQEILGDGGWRLALLLLKRPKQTTGGKAWGNLGAKIAHFLQKILALFWLNYP